MKFSHEVTFNIGDEVWMRTSNEHHGFVTGILFRPDGVRYAVSWAPHDETEHFDFELSREKPIDK